LEKYARLVSQQSTKLRWSEARRRNGDNVAALPHAMEENSTPHENTSLGLWK
jgi:hypothetical protein